MSNSPEALRLWSYSIHNTLNSVILPAHEGKSREKQKEMGNLFSFSFSIAILVYVFLAFSCVQKGHLRTPLRPFHFPTVLLDSGCQEALQLRASL